MNLVYAVNKLTHAYACKGGKTNRRQQRKRMQAFAKHAANMGANSLGQVGARHVINYWKINRSLSPATAYNHWLAIRELWQLADKSGEPPRPFMRNEHSQNL